MYVVTCVVVVDCEVLKYCVYKPWVMPRACYTLQELGESATAFAVEEDRAEDRGEGSGNPSPTPLETPVPPPEGSGPPPPQGVSAMDSVVPETQVRADPATYEGTIVFSVRRQGFGYRRGGGGGGL